CLHGHPSEPGCYTTAEARWFIPRISVLLDRLRQLVEVLLLNAKTAEVIEESREIPGIKAHGNVLHGTRAARRDHVRPAVERVVHDRGHRLLGHRLGTRFGFSRLRVLLLDL